MKKFKAGVIGCGTISPMHLQSLNTVGNVELKAVCDVNVERAADKANRYSCNYYTDYKEMLDREGLDVVHICTPHYLHAPMAIYAANRGVNVLTEKPMAVSLQDADDMIKAAKDSQVTLGVIFQNRYNPGSVLIKNTLESGELGRIISGRLSVVWHRSDSYYSESDWRGTWDREGGGVIINQAIHTLDLMRWFVDVPIDYVEANISNRFHPGIEVEDCAEGVIFYKNGVRALFYTTTSYSYDVPVELELHCENGLARLVADKAVIRFDDGREVCADVDKNEVMDYGDGVKSYWGVSHCKQIRAFYESLAKGERPFIDGVEARKTQELVCAIYRSGKENRRIYL
ncbi:MAG TPA: Gfo/Idh/MocA family oxidoreductase [Candidatus Atribacteria bacterium]|nr:Gfo/Idh/MocA family oxidoreductase [Candidatus Atribacteria bacterium]